MALHLSGLARLGRDAELRFTTDNTPVASLSLAFSYGRKGEDGKRPTQWVDASLWGPLAEAISPYLTKGARVAVLLEDVHIETFKKGDGTPGHKLAARVLSIELAGGGEQQQAPAQQQRRQTPAQGQQQRRPAQGQQQRPSTGFDDMDDDIPF